MSGRLDATNGERQARVTWLTYPGAMPSALPQLLLAALASVALVLLAAWGLLRLLRRDRALGTEATRHRHETLHLASAAAATLQRGLDEDSAPAAAAALHRLLAVDGVALLDADRLLASAGTFPRRFRPGGGAGAEDTTVHTVPDGARSSHVVVAPLRVGTRRVGTLEVCCSRADASLARAVQDTASWVSALLGVSELESQRTALAQAQVRAMRAQISPHFIYNSLNAIASFIHTDPERARELVLEFADFTRYSFRRTADVTTLAEELTAIEGYLRLERARFGSRLRFRLDVAKEALPLPLPFLTVQPLIENAVRHGLEASAEGGTVTLTVHDDGDGVLITVEDDGVGAEPDVIRSVLAGAADGEHVGLRNVDQRLRRLYGAAAGLRVDTAPGAGLAVLTRIPKFHPGINADVAAPQRQGGRA